MISLQVLVKHGPFLQVLVKHGRLLQVLVKHRLLQVLVKHGRFRLVLNDHPPVVLGVRTKTSKSEISGMDLGVPVEVVGRWS